MTDTEQPSQWAVDLLEAVSDAGDMGSACGAVNCPQCAKAALTIQRAFAKREAELVGALKPFAAMAAAYDPDDGDDDQWAFASRPTLGQVRTARAALKSREAGHG